MVGTPVTHVEIRSFFAVKSQTPAFTLQTCPNAHVRCPAEVGRGRWQRQDALREVAGAAGLVAEGDGAAVRIPVRRRGQQGCPRALSALLLSLLLLVLLVYCSLFTGVAPEDRQVVLSPIQYSYCCRCVALGCCCELALATFLAVVGWCYSSPFAKFSSW